MLRRNMRHSVLRRYLCEARGKSQITAREGDGLGNDSKIQDASLNSFQSCQRL